MTRDKRRIIKARILRLASLKGTGSPAELASRLEISVRTVKRVVSEIRDEGQDIRYCPSRKSYVMEKEFQ